jgi:myo-inositol-1(or 4)-monophosphatase
MPAMDRPSIASGLEQAVRKAAEVALHQFGQVRPERKPDRTLVTEADREVERRLVQELRALLPDAAVLAEEGTRSPQREREQPTWVVDPIDGTAVFVAGLPTWSISVALVDTTGPTLGCVHLPVSGEMFLATGEPPLRWNGAAVDRRPEGARWGPSADDQIALLVPSQHHRYYRVDFPGKLRSLGSTAAHFAWVARGVAVGAVARGRLWDLAGALACCQAAGVSFGYLSGAPVDWSALLEGGWTPEPVVAAHPLDLERVRDCVQWPR